MASSPLHVQHLNLSIGGRASKAQSCLAKIIAIISTVRPLLPDQTPKSNALLLGNSNGGGGGESEAPSSRLLPSNALGFGIDLNLRLPPRPEIGKGSTDDNGGPTASGGLVVMVTTPSESSDVSAVEMDFEKVPTETESVLTAGECDLEEGEEVDEGVEVDTEISNTPWKTVAKQEEEEGEEEEEESEERERRGNGSERNLGLLLEAVRQASGEFLDVEPAAAVADRRKRTGSVRSKRMCWTAFDLYEESAPIVRSKRGRTQTLPLRYRDSVIEPWGKQPAANRQWF